MMLDGGSFLLLLCATYIAWLVIDWARKRDLTKRIRNFLHDPLDDFEPVTDEELRLLSLIDEKLYVDLLTYVRTMKMSSALSEYLSTRKEILEAISYYMMLHVARAENEKRRQWAEERSNVVRPLTHIDRLILSRVKSRDPKEN
jgi:hypothetical protein